jgi:phosphinothricin acetyltransferase
MASAPQAGAGLQIRTATLEDAAAIWRIFNQGIEDRLATFAVEIPPLAEVESWLGDLRMRVLVAENFRQPVGWGSLGPYREGKPFRSIGEMSVYVERAWRRHAVGPMLAGALIEEARALGLRKLVGYLLEHNLSGRKMVEKLGFREVGVHLRHGSPAEIARDVVVVEKLL